MTVIGLAPAVLDGVNVASVPRLIALICRLLFWCFLRSATGNAFHPSALQVRLRADETSTEVM
jgi:hypothetical protein